MNRKIYTAFLLLWMPFALLQGQSYWVFFEDKDDQLHLLENPFALFSEKAVLRKAERQIDIDQTDLPVSPRYVEQIQEAGGKVIMRSKWLNAVLVEEIDSVVIAGLIGVKSIKRRGVYRSYFSEYADADYSYGHASLQTEMLRGDFLHDIGYTGTGMTIAVFDGGFHNAHIVPPLQDLHTSGRLLGTHSFISNDTNVYQLGSHGTHVLSILAGKVDGTFVGSAPNADYYLFSTEDENREVRAEEYNWLTAAEWSDSLGVDVINSSLGYNTFDPGEGDYTLLDLDGQTGIVTQAAQMAAQKGILVVNAAGNEGQMSWQKIILPADADSILAVGSVFLDKNRSLFSSMGPTADGRIKPDVMAMGEGTSYITTAGGVGTGNGTSLASPLIAGFATCLMQVYPHHSTENIRQTILQSADRYLFPDTLYGHGIPNFQMAFYNPVSVEKYKKEPLFSIYPNPAEHQLSVHTGDEAVGTVKWLIYAQDGRLIQQGESHQQTFDISLASGMASGSYLLHIVHNRRAEVHKFIKL